MPVCITYVLYCARTVGFEIHFSCFLNADVNKSQDFDSNAPINTGRNTFYLH